MVGGLRGEHPGEARGRRRGAPQDEPPPLRDGLQVEGERRTALVVAGGVAGRRGRLRRLRLRGHHVQLGSLFQGIAMCGSESDLGLRRVDGASRSPRWCSRAAGNSRGIAVHAGQVVRGHEDHVPGLDAELGRQDERVGLGHVEPEDLRLALGLLWRARTRPGRRRWCSRSRRCRRAPARARRHRNIGARPHGLHLSEDEHLGERHASHVDRVAVHEEPVLLGVAPPR